MNFTTPRALIFESLTTLWPAQGLDWQPCKILRALATKIHLFLNLKKYSTTLNVFGLPIK